MSWTRVLYFQQEPVEKSCRVISEVERRRQTNSQHDRHTNVSPPSDYAHLLAPPHGAPKGERELIGKYLCKYCDVPISMISRSLRARPLETHKPE
jgi:hypothetical protein